MALASRIGTWHPVALPDGRDGTRVFESEVSICRITAIIEWNRPQARRKFDRAIARLNLHATVAQRFGDDYKPYRIAFSIVGTELELREFVQSTFVAEWYVADADVAHRGTGATCKPR